MPKAKQSATTSKRTVYLSATLKLKGWHFRDSIEETSDNSELSTNGKIVDLTMSDESTEDAMTILTTQRPMQQIEGKKPRTLKHQ